MFGANSVFPFCFFSMHVWRVWFFIFVYNFEENDIQSRRTGRGIVFHPSFVCSVFCCISLFLFLGIRTFFLKLSFLWKYDSILLPVWVLDCCFPCDTEFVCVCVSSCVLVLSVLMKVKRICLIWELKFTKIVKYNVHLSSVTIHLSRYNKTHIQDTSEYTSKNSAHNEQQQCKSVTLRLEYLRRWVKE